MKPKAQQRLTNIFVEVRINHAREKRKSILYDLFCERSAPPSTYVLKPCEDENFNENQKSPTKPSAAKGGCSDAACSLVHVQLRKEQLFEYAHLIKMSLNEDLEEYSEENVVDQTTP